MKKVEKLEFSATPIAVEDMVGKSPTVIMRNIDSYRMYNPLEIEREKYNLPEGRMNLSTMQHIMYLCGAYVGLRFTSDEMACMADAARDIDRTFNSVNTRFGNLSAAAKKYGCTRSMLNLDADKKQSSKTVASPGAQAAQTTDVHTVTDATAAASLAMPPAPPAVTSALPVITEVELAAAATFATLARDFIEAVMELQTFMLFKQKECQAMRDEVGKVVIQKDPDGLSSSSKPKWLEILLTKFQSRLDEQHVAALEAHEAAIAALEEGATPPTQPRPVMLSVGKLSKFLGDAVCSNQHTNWSDVEQAALQELLCASIDSVSIFGPEAFGGVAAVSKEYYYAKRIFNFISVLSEMKSVPKDEKFIPIE